MPVLIFLLTAAKAISGKKLILAGLLFSWIGDGLLLCFGQLDGHGLLLSLAS